MKNKLYYVGIAVLMLVSACKKDNTSSPLESLNPGIDYVNDVYYSFANGVVATVPRTNWDLAFSTPVRTASILINDGAGIQLFTWKGGSASEFNNVGKNDSANITETSSLTNNNLDTTWFNSAFEQYMSKTNPYDVGWGLYNMNTHNVEGDSVYILKLANGTYKKIVILLHAGTAPYSFVFKIANLEQNAVADSITVAATQFSTKNFVYYSIANTPHIIDREPANTSWDILFTKYADRALGGYAVAGILTNNGVSSAKLSSTDTTYSQATYSNVISNIGYDWKSYSNATSTYTIVPRVYYIKTKDNHYYSMIFKSYDPTTRLTQFEKKLLK